MEKKITIERRKNNTNYGEDHYDRREHYFSSILADSALLERFYYELRYISYIQESRIPFETHPILNKMEVDEHDTHSLKFLLLYKPLHLFLGGNRMILPDEKKEYVGLPSLQFSKELKRLIPEKDWGEIGEISRFLISKERTQIYMQHLKSCNDKINLRKIEEQKLITLLLGCFQAGLHKKLKICIFSLEKSLIRLLQRLAIPLVLTNEELQYHGEAQVAMLYCDKVIEDLKKVNPKLLDFYLSHSLSEGETQS